MTANHPPVPQELEELVSCVSDYFSRDGQLSEAEAGAEAEGLVAHLAVVFAGEAIQVPPRDGGAGHGQ